MNRASGDFDRASTLASTSHQQVQQAPQRCEVDNTNYILMEKESWEDVKPKAKIERTSRLANKKNMTTDIFKTAPIKTRACSFFLKGTCKKTDCSFAHTLAELTIKDCSFNKPENPCKKGILCPFRHNETVRDYLIRTGKMEALSLPDGVQAIQNAQTKPVQTESFVQAFPTFSNAVVTSSPEAWGPKFECEKKEENKKEEQKKAKESNYVLYTPKSPEDETFVPRALNFDTVFVSPIKEKVNTVVSTVSTVSTSIPLEKTETTIISVPREHIGMAISAAISQGLKNIELRVV